MSIRRGEITFACPICGIVDGPTSAHSHGIIAPPAPVQKAAQPKAARPRGYVRPFAGNKTEAEYRDMLRVRELAGEIAWFRFEAITLKLADDTRYTPDFTVMLANGELQMHEIKGGFVREDAAIKLKVAAAQFPFRFYLAQKEKGKWTITER